MQFTEPPSFYFCLCMALIIIVLFYGGPYHPISLLEKDQYERIRRMRLIVYHHNLHMWCRVVYIGGMGGIGVLLEVLSLWHKRNIWFLHFNCFFHFHLVIWPIFKIIWTEIFISNFKNEKFQIKKMKNSIFSFQIFVTYFNPNLNIDFFFKIFHFLWPTFFKIQKTKNFNSNFKNNFFFKIFHFKFFLWHKQIFFLAWGCQI
jgi:hypothetical protein